MNLCDMIAQFVIKIYNFIKVFTMNINLYIFVLIETGIIKILSF